MPMFLKFAAPITIETHVSVILFSGTLLFATSEPFAEIKCFFSYQFNIGNSDKVTQFKNFDEIKETVYLSLLYREYTAKKF